MNSYVFAFMVSLMFFAWAFSAEPGSGEVYKVDPPKSEVAWLAKKVTGQHDGVIQIKSGMLEVSDNMIKSGHFVVDMTSIVCLDLEDPGYNKKLVDHLKSDDFFSVETFPTSEMKITEVTKGKEDNMVQVKGDLTIKGITKPVEFPAEISMEGEKLSATADIVINRAEYDVRYGSGSFFKGLGDKLIYDYFNLTVSLVAMKQ